MNFHLKLCNYSLHIDPQFKECPLFELSHPQGKYDPQPLKSETKKTRPQGLHVEPILDLPSFKGKIWRGTPINFDIPQNPPMGTFLEIFSQKLIISR